MKKEPDVARYADMFAAIGAEPRLRILRLLLSAHPTGMIVSDIQTGLGIPNSTLSHHLEKLKHEGLIVVRRDRQFLWYSANTETLTELLAFLYSECCSGTGAVRPESVVVPLNSLTRRKP
jgi:ArsR family transcriptional regulator